MCYAKNLDEVKQTMSVFKEEIQDNEAIYEAIRLIPDAQKGAYLEALKVGLQFIEAESNPFLFLRREGCNSRAAAQRLVSYWEDRKTAFGEMAFVPLSFASYTNEAMRALWEGVFVQLPNDSRGRTVLYRDNTKLATLSLKARLQLIFYLDGVSANNPRSVEEGIVLITTVEIICFDHNTKICRRVANESMPTRPISLHILCSGKEAQADTIALNVVRWYLKEGTHVHVCKTPEERSRALSPFGLKTECLPDFLGGSAKLDVRPYQSKELCSKGMGTNKFTSVYYNVTQNVSIPVYIDIEGISRNSPDIPTSCSDFELKKIISQELQPTKVFSGEQVRSLEKKGSRMRSSVSEKEIKPSRPRKRQRQSAIVSDNDVLLGKGVKYAEHPGNLRLQKFIEKFRSTYEEAHQRYKKTQKNEDYRFLQQIKQDIYGSIRQSGRFLKCDEDDCSIESDDWYEVKVSTALKKIAVSFRYHESLKDIRYLVKAGSEPISTALESDVLLGKGTKYSRHPGNLRLLNLVKMHSIRYDEASKKHKATHGNEACCAMNRILREVYTSICQTGRFLKYVKNDNSSLPGSWYEVSGDIALKKIAMSFRNLRKRKRSPVPDEWKTFVV